MPKPLDNKIFLLLSVVSLTVISLLFCSCNKTSAEPTGQTPVAYTVAPGSDPPADDGQWVMPAKDYDATRYSQLNQITPSNVKNLQVAWTFSTGMVRGHEAAPLVVGDTMYIVTPFPNYLYALDLKNKGAMKWVYKPDVAEAAEGVACCDVVNRGPVY